MAPVVAREEVPPDQSAGIGTQLSQVNAFSNLVGPLISGRYTGGLREIDIESGARLSRHSPAHQLNLKSGSAGAANMSAFRLHTSKFSP